MASSRNERMRLLEKVHVHNVYDRIAPCVSSRRHKPWPKVCQFLQELEPGSLVADIGCGDGRYLGVNADSFGVGCDRCSGMVDITRAHGHQVALGDGLTLPFRDGAFDAVLSVSVIHHLSSKQRRVAALHEMARVLAVGGRVLIYVWAMEQKHRKFDGQDVLVPCKIPTEPSPLRLSDSSSKIAASLVTNCQPSVKESGKDQEKPRSNSSSLSDDDPSLDSPKVLLHHSNSEEFEETIADAHRETADTATASQPGHCSSSSSVSGAAAAATGSSRYLFFSATAADAIRTKLGLASSEMDAGSKERLDSDVDSEAVAAAKTKKHGRVSAIKDSVLLCFNSRTLAEFFHARHRADKTSERASVAELREEGATAAAVAACQFLAADTCGRIFEVREFPRSSLVGSPSQLSLDEQYVRTQKPASETDLFGESASVYDGFIGLRKLKGKDHRELPARSEVTISSPDLAGKPPGDEAAGGAGAAAASLEQRTSPKYRSAEVLSVSSLTHTDAPLMPTEKYQSAEQLADGLGKARLPQKPRLSAKGEESSLSSLEEVENGVLTRAPSHRCRPQQQLTLTSNTSLTSNSSNDSHDSGISADMSDSGRQSEGEQVQRPLDVIKEAENNGAGSPEAAARVDVSEGSHAATAPEPISDRSSDSTSSSASLDEQHVVPPPLPPPPPPLPETSAATESSGEAECASPPAMGNVRVSWSSTSSDSDDTVIAAERSPDWLGAASSSSSSSSSSPPSDIASFYTLTASDEEENGAAAGGAAATGGASSPPCYLPDYLAEVYFSDSDEEEGELAFEQADIGTFSFDRFCIPDDVDAFCFASIGDAADLCQTRSHSLKSESVSSEDSSATVIENPLSKEEEDLDNVFAEEPGPAPAPATKPRKLSAATTVASPTMTVRAPTPEVPQYSSRKSMFHRYYHVFARGELDELIERHVDNLHIIKSFYDHSNWCIVAEKVQVWNI